MSAAVMVEQPMDPPGRRLAALGPPSGPLPVPGRGPVDAPSNHSPSGPLPSVLTVVPDRGTEELDLAAQMLSGWAVAPAPAVPAAMRAWTVAPSPAVVAPLGGMPGSEDVRPTLTPRWGPRVPARVDRSVAPGVRRGDDRGELVRLGLHLLVAALPLLAISAHVFGVLTMNRSAGLLVVPLAALAVGLCVVRPLRSDRLIVEGLLWGLLATVLYDAFRWDTVYLLGWWGDFIPTLGTWILDISPRDRVTGAVAGYTWRYLGDGGGIGMTFFVAAAATGLRRLGRTATVATAVGFAVFPVWAGLIATVGLSGRGQTLMFRLTPTTITLSLIGHLIFGVVLGVGTWRSMHLESAWPWTPLLDRVRLRPHPCLGPWTDHTDVRPDLPMRSEDPQDRWGTARPTNHGAAVPTAAALPLPRPGPLRQDPPRQDPPRQDPPPQDPPRQDPPRQDPLRHDPLRHDPLRHDPRRQGPPRPGPQHGAAAAVGSLGSPR